MNKRTGFVPIFEMLAVQLVSNSEQLEKLISLVVSIYRLKGVPDDFWERVDAKSREMVIAGHPPFIDSEQDLTELDSIVDAIAQIKVWLNDDFEFEIVTNLVNNLRFLEEDEFEIRLERAKANVGNYFN